MTDLVPVHELATATYCPRKLYYERRDDDREPPPPVERVRSLAFRYPALLDAPDERLAHLPVEVGSAAYRRRLRGIRERWPGLFDPAERDVVLEGRDCRGRAAKVLAGEPPIPTFVSTGRPPEQGVWRPQSVRAVALAKALSWREQVPVERALVEYPAHGVVRSVGVSARRTAEYRRALRTVRALDGPPPRIGDDAKCGACEYRTQCGVRTRSLRSLLGD